MAVKKRIISSEEIEFDYVHPNAKKRVRRKITASEAESEIILYLLNLVLEEKISIEKCEELIKTDPAYNKFGESLLKTINTLYYDYDEKHIYIDEEAIVEDSLSNILGLHSDINICFLGRAGIGKSSIIRKLSDFSNTDINFPFVDTSRTTTFSTKYYFTEEKVWYKMGVSFIPDLIMKTYIEEALERGISRALSFKSDVADEEDSIVSSINSDSVNFNVKLLLGNYVKKSSKNYDENQPHIKRWNTIVEYCKAIAFDITKHASVEEHSMDFYRERLSTMIKSNDDNPVKRKYIELCEYVFSYVFEQKNNLIKKIENSECIKKIEIEDKEDSFFAVEYNLNNLEAFSEMISILVSKSYKNYNNSLLPFINTMKTEIPYNKHIADKSISLCCFDTVGIAHGNDSSSGFRNSTELQFDDMNAVIIVDDSRASMNNDVSVILKHIFSRLDYKKIYFALTFYDELSKEEFDPEEDMDEQKKQYLINIQKSKILEYLDDNVTSIPFSERVVTKNFYLSGLKNNGADGLEGIDKMLKIIRQDSEIYHNTNKVCKDDKTKPLLIYDNKILAIIYDDIQNKFIKSQEDIYITNPPHYKTTEALTRRLMNKEKSFQGKKLLKPVDDLYDVIISQVKKYLLNPSSFNIIGETDEDKRQCLENLNTFITDKLSSYVKQLFFSPKMLEIWNQLWSDCGAGVDYRRRTGIIKAETMISPNISDFLQDNNSSHMLATLDRFISDSITEYEKKIL